jgi:predicted xylan-binding protein with Ca-dependent carbohydrate-binding module
MTKKIKSTVKTKAKVTAKSKITSPSKKNKSSIHRHFTKRFKILFTTTATLLIIFITVFSIQHTMTTLALLNSAHGDFEAEIMDAAPGKVVTTTTSTVAHIEGEAMKPSTTWVSPVQDLPGASGGKVLGIWHGGKYASTTLTTSNVSTKINVIARSTNCNGYARVVVAVDGKTFIDSITTGSLANYSAAASLTAGTHTITVKFPADSYIAGICDRNLYVDAIDLTRNVTSTISQPFATVINDTNASGKKALSLYRNGVASYTTSTPIVNAMTVYAKGQLCQGLPTMVIKVNNIQLFSKPVAADGYAAYTVPVALAAGSARVDISFANDYYLRGQCDRNLLLDRVEFTVVSPPPVTPPVSTCSPSMAKNAIAYQNLGGNDMNTKLNSTTNFVTLDKGTFSFDNFNKIPSNGSVLVGLGLTKPAGIIGNGIDSTILQMTPNSSTRASSVPTANGTTNQLSLMYYGQKNGLVLQCFTLKGTPQGHLHNGLTFNAISNATISHLKLSGAGPGNKNSPPGETFAINDYRGTNNTYSNVEIDGAGTGASAFAANSTAGGTWTDDYAHDNPYSAGIALWQMTGTQTLTNFKSVSNRVGINLERVYGTVNVTKPILSKSSLADVYLGNDKNSTKLNIYDPVLDSGKKLVIFYPSGLLGIPNTNIQKKSDVKVYRDGKDITNEIVQWK